MATKENLADPLDSADYGRGLLMFLFVSHLYHCYARDAMIEHLSLHYRMADKYEQWFKSVDTDGSGSLAYSELYDFLTSQRGYTDKQVEVSVITSIIYHLVLP